VFGRPRQPPQRLHTEVFHSSISTATRVVGHETTSSRNTVYGHPNTPSHFTGHDRHQTAATAAHDTPNICRNRHIRLFVNTDSRSTARLSPGTGYSNVLVENSVHFVYDAESRDEQVPTFRNNVLPSPSCFNNPVTLRFGTTDLTENTPIGVTNINYSHSCYSDLQVSRCSLAHCHCSSECTWDFLLCQPTAASGFRLPQSVALPRNEITTRKKGG